MEKIIKRVKDFLKEKKSVKEAYIFGSFARNEATKKSDIDIIVIMQTDKPFFDRYEEFSELLFSLPVAVDLLIYTPEEWDEIKDRLFFRRAMKEAKKIT